MQNVILHALSVVSNTAGGRQNKLLYIYNGMCFCECKDICRRICRTILSYSSQPPVAFAAAYAQQYGATEISCFISKEIKNTGGRKVTKYKFLKFTILRKEKTPYKKKWNILGIKFGKKLKAKSEPPALPAAENNAGQLFTSVNKMCRKIDIIIPVWNGFEYLENLFKSIKDNTDLPYRLLVIDDCSTDKRVSVFLKKQKKIFGDILILKRNPHNLGFLISVNKMLEISEYDAVLMNTDVVLPRNWASRLFRPVFSDPAVASVTPFSNAATIFSLPEICKDNILYGDLEKINESLAAFTACGKKLKFATGVGFCMAVSKKALEKVGMLDEIFEKGYGEENDWCQRAIKAGFYNTVATDLFVWHKHGGSFASEEKQKLISSHMKLLLKRYPDYEKDVSDNIKDPYLSFIHFTAELLYFNAVAENTELWFDHTWGGGTLTYTENIAHKYKNSILFIYVRQDRDGRTSLSYKYLGFANSAVLSGISALKTFAGRLKISKIVLNNLASYKNIPDTLCDIADIKRITRAKVSFRGHDFQCICPTINMMDKNDKYCAASSCKKCTACIHGNKNMQIPCRDIQAYQYMWRRFLTETADEIIVFCESTKNILTSFIPEIRNKITVTPHFIKELRKVNIPPHEGINIGITGNINTAKGSAVVNRMADFLRGTDVKIHVNGKLYPCTSKHVIVHGTYNNSELPDILEKEKIDIVFIPSVWPETFSHTTGEAIKTGIPVCCYNLGGQAEQVKKYKKGLVLTEINIEKNVKDMLGFLNKK